MKGFLFTLDASISLIILIGFAAILVGNSWEINLDEETRIQIVQDAAEVCILKGEINNECVKKLVEDIGSEIHFNEACGEGTRIRREHIGYEGIDVIIC